ncbi:hypothetical protein LNQ03_08305 [Klebsiella pneumoniae subsp. pneumoniae]|nr:hypothetical protein [Klebsiella pneumoniae subsp. pneumoniae]
MSSRHGSLITASPGGHTADQTILFSSGWRSGAGFFRRWWFPPAGSRWQRRFATYLFNSQLVSRGGQHSAYTCLRKRRGIPGVTKNHLNELLAGTYRRPAGVRSARALSQRRRSGVPAPARVVLTAEEAHLRRSIRV